MGPIVDRVSQDSNKASCAKTNTHHTRKTYQCHNISILSPQCPPLPTTRDEDHPLFTPSRRSANKYALEEAVDPVGNGAKLADLPTLSGGDFDVSDGKVIFLHDSGTKAWLLLVHHRQRPEEVWTAGRWPAGGRLLCRRSRQNPPQTK